MSSVIVCICAYVHNIFLPGANISPRIIKINKCAEYIRGVRFSAYRANIIRGRFFIPVYDNRRRGVVAILSRRVYLSRPLFQCLQSYGYTFHRSTFTGCIMIVGGAGCALSNVPPHREQVPVIRGDGVPFFSWGSSSTVTGSLNTISGEHLQYPRCADRAAAALLSSCSNRVSIRFTVRPLAFLLTVLQVFPSVPVHLSRW